MWLVGQNTPQYSQGNPIVMHSFTQTYLHTQLDNHLDNFAIQSLNTPSIVNTLDPTTLVQWIEEFANINNTTKSISSKNQSQQTAINCEMAITKYRTLFDKKPNVIHISKDLTNHPTTCKCVRKYP